jgi:CheY-like chemotaxis protein
VHMLDKLGYRCDIASNGKEAVEMLDQMPYDLVLMDCQMPEMDGYTATQHIRARETSGESGRHTPILAMTANAMREDRALCLDCGMDGFIPKPIALDELETALDCWLPEGGKLAAPVPVSSVPTGVIVLPATVAAPTDVGEEAEALSDKTVVLSSAPTLTSVPAALPTSSILSSSPQGSMFSSSSLDVSVLDGLRYLQDDNGEFIAGLVTTYVADTAVRLGVLRTALVAHDFPTIDRAAHTIKGSSGNMGATRMASIGSALQQAGKVADLTTATRLITEMEVEFIRTRALLESTFLAINAA